LIRLLYSAAWWLVLPLVLARLWWRGRKEPGYRQHMAERFGFYLDKANDRRRQSVIWVHAVSVGETRAAEPLIDALLAAYPDYAILLTCMTPTGRATGQILFGGRVRQSYLPYDIGWLVGRFIRRFTPSICVLMETEVWPNVMAACERYRVPVVLVNARLSPRSLAKGQRLSGLIRDAAGRLTCVAAQTEADAARLRQLGAPDVCVTGSIKFDVTPPPAMLDKGAWLRDRIGARPVLLCAITRDGEEALILDALVKAEMGNTLLMIVPRHPQRFDEVARLIAAHGLIMRRRSELEEDAPLPAEVQVLLGDSMGEMFAYHVACDVAFIGGSLLPLGGHNLIEACAVGKPVLIGPSTFNFSAASEDAIAAGAALCVADASMLLREALRLLQEDGERSAMGARALAFAQQHRGATARTMALLRPLIR
jgi:3-deoxy-D-manno-octulosonic-acid transferase